MDGGGGRAGVVCFGGVVVLLLTFATSAATVEGGGGGRKEGETAEADLGQDGERSDPDVKKIPLIPRNIKQTI